MITCETTRFNVALNTPALSGCYLCMPVAHMLMLQAPKRLHSSEDTSSTLTPDGWPAALGFTFMYVCMSLHRSSRVLRGRSSCTWGKPVKENKSNCSCLRWPHGAALAIHLRFYTLIKLYRDQIWIGAPGKNANGTSLRNWCPCKQTRDVIEHSCEVYLHDLFSWRWNLSRWISWISLNRKPCKKGSKG